MIVLPNLDSFNVAEKSRELKSILLLKNEPTVRFNLVAIRRCDPFGMIIVGMAIRSILLGKEITAEGLNSINEYAGSMCFYDFIGVKDIGIKLNTRDGTSKHIPITIVNKESLLEDCRRRNITFIRALREYSLRIAKVLSRNSKKTEVAFEYLIREMLRNIFEHSGSNCAYICGQFWPSYDLIEIAIADDGIGLANSLRTNMNYVDLISTDKLAVDFAMTPGISKSFTKTGNPLLNPDENSGFGLYMASELCIALKGSFSIVSGSHSKYIGANIQNDELLYYDVKANHEGTAVMLRIRPSYLDNFEQIFDLIIEKGENIARENSLAFKSASQLSKKLSTDLY